MPEHTQTRARAERQSLVERRKKPLLAQIEPSTATAMHRALPSQTAECVMDRFGISVNTWVKIRDGQPIRPSVADRLIERLRREGIVD
jgi:hypothetical protein